MPRTTKQTSPILVIIQRDGYMVAQTIYKVLLYVRYLQVHQTAAFDIDGISFPHAEALRARAGLFFHRCCKLVVQFHYGKSLRNLRSVRTTVTSYFGPMLQRPSTRLSRDVPPSRGLPQVVQSLRGESERRGCQRSPIGRGAACRPKSQRGRSARLDPTIKCGLLISSIPSGVS